MTQILSRRQWWAHAAVLAAAAAHSAPSLARASGLGAAAGATPGAAHLPLAHALPDQLAQALRRKQPLLAMVSLEGCVFCKAARAGHLLPMHQAGAVLVQLDMRSSHPVRDWEGRWTTHEALIKQWRVTVAPTLLFFGPAGKEVAARMEGAYLPDFYGAYLDERMAQGSKALAAL